jgi:hypothetical protein
MGWERRGKGGKKLVYIRKKRVGRRVMSIYVGSGEVGERAEREDRARREAVEALRRGDSVPPQAAEVLPVAPLEVLPVAPAQVEEAVADTEIAPEDRWAKFFNRPQQPRRYRRW